MSEFTANKFRFDLWHRLVEPPHYLREPIRRRARLLSGLLLSLLMLVALAFVIPFLYANAENPFLNPATPVAGAATACLLVAYALNHRGRYEIAARLTVAVAAVGAWATIFVNRDSLADQQLLFMYLMVSVALSGTLLSARAVTLLAGLHIAGLLIAFVGFIDALIAFGFLSVLTVVAASITQHDLAQIERQTRELVDREKRFRSLIENSSDAIAVVDPRGAPLYVSPSSTRLFGYTEADRDNRGPFELIHPDDQADAAKLLAEIIVQPGKIFTTECRIKHKDGAWRWIEVSVQNLLAEPSVQGIVANYRDITERKGAEEALREADRRAIRDYERLLGRLTNLAQAVGTARDLPAAYRGLLDFARLSVPCSELFVILRDAERRENRFVYVWRRGREVEVSHYPAWPLADSPENQALAEGRIVFTEDLRDAAPDSGRSREAAPTGSTLNVPLIVLGRLIGVLVVHSDELSAFNPEHLTAMRMAANLGAIATETVRLLQRERRLRLAAQVSEERARHETARAEALARVAARLNAQLDLEAVLNSVCEETAQALGAPVVMVGLSTPALDASAPAAGYGLPAGHREQLRPVPAGLAPAPERRAENVAVIHDVRAVPDLPGAEVYQALNLRTLVEVALMRGAHRVGYLSILTAGATRDFGDDELALLRGIGDQAAQAIANARLYLESSRRLEHLQSMRAIDQAITTSLDLQYTLKILLEQVTSRLGVHAADVLLLQPHIQMLEYAARSGFRTGMLRHTHLRLGEGHAGRAAIEQRVVHVPNLVDNPGTMPLDSLLIGERFVAYYAVPLVAKGEVKGVLEIFHRATLDPDPEWPEFLEALARQAAIAIDNALLFADLQRSNVDLALAYEATLDGWSKALDLRDRETEGHTQRVTEVTVWLARKLIADEADLAHIRRGALLHDIGKMGIPDSILLKPGPLTVEEWAIMRKHPIYAYELLSPIAFLRPALDIPYSHHEKWNGTGYPRGLKGEQIPLAARVFAVVDVWDALRSDRPYRRSWPEEQVREYLIQEAGRHFDPHVVDAFLQLLIGG